MYNMLRSIDTEDKIEARRRQTTKSCLPPRAVKLWIIQTLK